MPHSELAAARILDHMTVELSLDGVAGGCRHDLVDFPLPERPSSGQVLLVDLLRHREGFLVEATRDVGTCREVALRLLDLEAFFAAPVHVNACADTVLENVGR